MFEYLFWSFGVGVEGRLRDVLLWSGVGRRGWSSDPHIVAVH